MYKVKHVAVSVFILIGACSFVPAVTASDNFHDKDSIIINNETETAPPYTEINPELSTSVPPQPPTSSVAPDSTTSNTTTSSSTTVPTTPSTAPTIPTTAPTTPTTVPTPPPPPKPITTTTTAPTTLNPNVTSTVSPNSTTPIPVTTVKPTAAPTTPVPSHRRFDGPSFIGGIVLALGLVAIGFVAFKFYKARTELNYHTL